MPTDMSRHRFCKARQGGPRWSSTSFSPTSPAPISELLAEPHLEPLAEPHLEQGEGCVRVCLGRGTIMHCVALSSRTAQTLPCSWLLRAPTSHMSQCKASHSFLNFRKTCKDSGKWVRESICPMPLASGELLRIHGPPGPPSLWIHEIV